DDLPGGFAGLLPDHANRVYRLGIGIADAEVVVDGKIPVRAVRWGARDGRAVRAPIEELEDGMTRLAKPSGSHDHGVHEDTPVAEQTDPVARQALIRTHLPDPRDPEVRRVHPGSSAHMRAVEEAPDRRAVA